MPFRTTKSRARGGDKERRCPAPPRRLPSSRCNKAALSGPPSVCRRVRDSCVLRFSAPGGPALQGRAPPRPAAGLHCCWSVPGSRQVISPALRHARKDLALLALTARYTGRSRGDSWRRVPRTKTSCNKSLEALRAAQGHAWALGRRVCNKSLEALRAAQGHAWALRRRV